jgi:hypothetical protein
MMFLSLSLVRRNPGSNAYTVTDRNALHSPNHNAPIYNNLDTSQPMGVYGYWESMADDQNPQSVRPNPIDVYS